MLRKLIHSISLLLFVFVMISCRNYNYRDFTSLSRSSHFAANKEKRRNIVYTHFVHSGNEMMLINSDTLDINATGVKGELMIPNSQMVITYQEMKSHQKKNYKKIDRRDIFQVHHYMENRTSLNPGDSIYLNQSDILNTEVYFHRRNWISGAIIGGVGCVWGIIAISSWTLNPQFGGN